MSDNNYNKMCFEMLYLLCSHYSYHELDNHPFLLQSLVKYFYPKWLKNAVMVRWIINVYMELNAPGCDATFPFGYPENHILVLD